MAERIEKEREHKSKVEHWISRRGDLKQGKNLNTLTDQAKNSAVQSSGQEAECYSQKPTCKATPQIRTAKYVNATSKKPNNTSCKNAEKWGKSQNK